MWTINGLLTVFISRVCYSLVWSKTRRQLADQTHTAGVALSELCRDLHVSVVPAAEVYDCQDESELPCMTAVRSARHERQRTLLLLQRGTEPASIMAGAQLVLELCCQGSSLPGHLLPYRLQLKAMAALPRAPGSR